MVLAAKNFTESFEAAGKKIGYHQDAETVRAEDYLEQVLKVLRTSPVVI